MRRRSTTGSTHQKGLAHLEPISRQFRRIVMRTGKQVLRKSAETHKDSRASSGRFRIVKLEERIAPNAGGVPNTGNGAHKGSHIRTC
jgi:hypothetical protein